MSNEDLSKEILKQAEILNTLIRTGKEAGMLVSSSIGTIKGEVTAITHGNLASLRINNITLKQVLYTTAITR